RPRREHGVRRKDQVRGAGHRRRRVRALEDRRHNVNTLGQLNLTWQRYVSICGPTTYELGLALATQPFAGTDYPHALFPKFRDLSRTVANERAVRACFMCLMLVKLPRSERWRLVR